jgi:tRNA-dihydrouridine synthase B
MLSIGTLKLRSRLILSPLAGISDLPFRLLCRKFGCELAFIEMINCRSISHKSRRTLQMLEFTSLDKPLGVQLLGCEPKFILKGLDVLKELRKQKKCRFDLLDFNAACPAKKVVRRGEGASLIREPGRLREILKLVVKNCDVPVSVKLRSGWDENTVNAREVALYCQEAGVKAVFIHGRTRTQGYHGSVDYQVIAKAKKALEIPVIASGDIFSPQLAKKMLDETGCDGIAVARGCLGNPWIFDAIENYLKKGVLLPEPGPEEIKKVMTGHLKACVDYYQEKNGVIIFRKFFSWYTRGFRQIRHLREKSSRAKTSLDMTHLIEAVR